MILRSLRENKPEAKTEVDKENLVLVWGSGVPEHEVFCVNETAADGRRPTLYGFTVTSMTMHLSEIESIQLDAED